jgi:SAM-dependent methyltransferase
MGVRRTFIESTPVRATFGIGNYLFFRTRLLAAEFRERRAVPGPTDEPIPPAKLRFRVNATMNTATHVEVGQNIAQDIKDLCNITGRDFYSFADILDFGCGCGRVIQNFRDRPESCTLHATDIDPELVNWCRSNLDGIDWNVNEHRPPLPFQNDAFDLIYGISVFTHLDEDFQHAWLRDLQRVARPGATLILTVHGEDIIERLGNWDRSYADEAHERGLLFLSGPKGKLKVDGLPDFYQTAFHTREYIYREWSEYFDILNYVERGINKYQDAVILRKPS